MPQFQSNGLIKYYIRLEKYLFKFEFQRKKRREMVHGTQLNVGVDPSRILCLKGVIRRGGGAIGLSGRIRGIIVCGWVTDNEMIGSAPGRKTKGTERDLGERGMITWTLFHDFHLLLNIMVPLLKMGMAPCHMEASWGAPLPSFYGT